jgi:hypothetical protein
MVTMHVLSPVGPAYVRQWKFGKITQNGHVGHQIVLLALANSLAKEKIYNRNFYYVI